MKRRIKPIRVKTAEQLGAALGLSPEDAIEMELRSELNAKIIEIVKKRGLTHAAVARLAHTSRTRVTALLNCNTKNISTSLMIRILACLGVKAKLTYIPSKIAA